MGELQQLYNWFYLDALCANTQISNCSFPLWVAPIEKKDNYGPLEIDYTHFAFAEKNICWDIEYFHWLKNFLLIENPHHAPIFIFDNHNHALPFWYMISDNLKKTEEKIPRLIHIDQHSDCWENLNKLYISWEDDEMEKVFNFSNKKCNVGNFIPPALNSWIISTQTQVRSISALQNLFLHIKEPFILDIDLDFCLNWTSRNKIDENHVNILKAKYDYLSKYASGISIATSPYFLDQNLAISIINKLFS